MLCKEVDFGIDEAFYIYTEKLHHTELDFWQSKYIKIDYILGKFAEELQGNSNNAGKITSMKDIPGW